jgi:2-haloacid dehalogenase
MPVKRPIRAALFDAYGTLLDVHSAAARHSARLGAAWEAVSALWRAKQLEYSWVRSLTGPGQHRDFWMLTQQALDFALARHGIADGALREDLLAAHRALSAYPEVPGCLADLRARGIATAILSNGEPKMLADGVAAAGLRDLLDEVLSVESVGVFKPHPSVYEMACGRFGGDAGAIGFVSSNAWDAQAAAHFGMRVVWVNRAGQPDEYDLSARAALRPDLASPLFA